MESVIHYYVEAWKRSFDYTGRSPRPAYWWFYLANLVLAFVLILFSKFSDLFGWILSLYAPATILPTLPLTIRRLRDAGKAWPWIFIGLVPIVGAIWAIVLLCQPSVGPLAV
jgi:uncharacterized membrane protein YhaH (DUF805 family)